MSLYGRFYSTIPKRKPSNKKERDLLSQAIKRRQALVNQSDA